MGRNIHSAALTAAVALLASCTAHWFSEPNVAPSQDRPVVRIETLGGVELGAATDHGILFLGRTAQSGPCRVHYFLGNQMFVEDGTIEHVGGVFYAATIDLRHQHARLLGRDVTPDDTLLAYTVEGETTNVFDLRLARGDGIDGDVTEYPGVDLRVGTPLFVRNQEDRRLELAGLVAGVATYEGGDDPRRYLVFAGPDRLREMLLAPRVHPPQKFVKHRPDGITVVK